jgi:hypothetical protein
VGDEEDKDDPEVAYLKAKMNKSAAKTVEAILEQPEMKRLIRKTLVREALKSSIILCLLFTGIFTIYNALRSAVNWGLAGDVAAGATLILVAAAYLLWTRRS